MVDHCTHLEEFRDAQMGELREGIDEDKWYMSERAGGDVGMKAAEEDFVLNYLPSWAHNFRLDFCNNKCCEEVGDCEAYQYYIKKMGNEIIPEWP